MPRKRPFNYAKGTKVTWQESQRRIESTVKDRIPGADRYRLYHEEPPNAPYERWIHYWEQPNPMRPGQHDIMTFDVPRIDRSGRRLDDKEYDEVYRTMERLAFMLGSQIERGIASPAVVFHMYWVNPATGKTLYQQLMEDHVLKLPPPNRNWGDRPLH